MASNAVKVTIAAVLIIAAIVLIGVFTSQKAPPHAVVINPNYTSFSNIENHSTSVVLQNPNMTAWYVYTQIQPQTLSPSNSSVANNAVFKGFFRSYETIKYNKMGRLASFTIPSYSSLGSHFYVNGTIYYCFNPANSTGQANETCHTQGSAPFSKFGLLNLINMSQRSYLSNENGLGRYQSFSNLVWSNYIVQNATYGANGYPATYYYAQLTDPNDSRIRGLFYTYIWNKYDIPLSTTVLLYDPLYNATNDTTMVQLNMINFSTTVNRSSVLPAYFVDYLNSNASKNGAVT